MKVWLITVGEEIPTDPGTPRLLRTGILARHLTGRSHDVTWWNSTYSHQKKFQRFEKNAVLESPEGYRIVLLHSRPYKRNVSFARFLNHRDLAASFQREVGNHAPPDVIVCSYPTIELADAAVAFARDHKIPIAVDIRDLWPDVFETYLPSVAQGIVTPLFAGLRQARHRIVRGATSIIGVTDAYIDWALQSAVRTRTELDRAFHLTVDPILPAKEQITAAEQYWDRLGVLRENQSVGCFPGSLSWTRDLLTVLNASHSLDDAEKQRLRLIYCGPEELMRTIIEASSNSPQIVCAGWRNAAEIHVLLSRSRFGMLPYPRIPNFTLNMPNKVGEFLSQGLPIMTALTGETRKLLDNFGIGLFYDPNNLNSIVQCLRIALEASEDQIASWRSAALDAYNRHFNAAITYNAFSDYVEELAQIKCRSLTWVSGRNME